MIFKNNKTYDILKIITLRVLPAILTFTGIVLKQINYENTEMVLIIGAGFITMLGQILGISNDKYNNIEVETDYSEDEELLNERDDE